MRTLQSRFSMVVAALVAIIVVLVARQLGHPWLGAGGGSGMLLFGLASPWQENDIIRQLIAWNVLDGAGGLLKRIVAKTADYTIVSSVTSAGSPSGTIFTNRGALGTVIFTLPAPVPALAGVWYEFLGIADFTITFKTATADTLILVNDLTADSLSMQTAGHLIGAHMRVVCDGTSWIGYGDSVGDTFTVAT